MAFLAQSDVRIRNKFFIQECFGDIVPLSGSIVTEMSLTTAVS